ncbi:MAG: hypothetical protein QM762_13260 [Chryseolinea sp.]
MKIVILVEIACAAVDMRKVVLLFVLFFTVMWARVVKAQSFDTVKVSGYIWKEAEFRKPSKKHRDTLYSPIDIVYTYKFLVCKDSQCELKVALKCFEDEPIDSIFSFCPILHPHTFFTRVLNTSVPKEFQCPLPELNSTCTFRLKDKEVQVFFVEGFWIRTRYDSNLNVLKPPFDTHYSNFRGIADLFYLIKVNQFNSCIEKPSDR